MHCECELSPKECARCPIRGPRAFGGANKHVEQIRPCQAKTLFIVLSNRSHKHIKIKPGNEDIS